jgi:hypothetical protein
MNRIFRSLCGMKKRLFKALGVYYVQQVELNESEIIYNEVCLGCCYRVSS